MSTRLAPCPVVGSRSLTQKTAIFAKRAKATDTPPLGDLAPACGPLPRPHRRSRSSSARCATWTRLPFRTRIPSSRERSASSATRSGRSFPTNADTASSARSARTGSSRRTRSEECRPRRTPPGRTRPRLSKCFRASCRTPASSAE